MLHPWTQVTRPLLTAALLMPKMLRNPMRTWGTRLSTAGRSVDCRHRPAPFRAGYARPVATGPCAMVCACCFRMLSQSAIAPAWKVARRQQLAAPTRANNALRQPTVHRQVRVARPINDTIERVGSSSVVRTRRPCGRFTPQARCGRADRGRARARGRRLARRACVKTSRRCRRP